MNIEDICPERRNLIVINIIVLCFFWGEGDVGGTLALPIFGVTLFNPFWPIVIFWFIYAWMVFRYWLAFKHEPFIRSYDNRPFKNAAFEKNDWRTAFICAVASIKVNGSDAIQSLEKYGLSVPESIKNSEAPHLFLFKEHSDPKTRWILVSAGHPAGISNHGIFAKRPLTLILKQFLKSFKHYDYATAWYLPWFLVVVTVITILVSLVRFIVEIAMY